MFESIEVEGLRGLHIGPIDGLAPVTLVVGANGSGKSTLLEALGVLCAGTDAQAAFEALSRREWLGQDGLRFLFTGPKGQSVIRGSLRGVQMPVPLAISLGMRDAAHQTLRSAREALAAKGELITIGAAKGASPEEDPPEVLVDEDGNAVVAWAGEKRLPFALETAAVDRPAGAKRRFDAARFSSAHREALKEIKLTPWYDDLITYLKELRPSLESIESLAVGERDEPHVFEGKPRVGYPLAYAGDGFRRSLLLAACFARAKGGVAAVDEPEAFTNPRLVRSLTKLMRRAVGDGTQLVFATHSIELVGMVLEEFQDDPAKCAVVCLRNERGRVSGVVVSGPDAQRRVLEMGDDLRL